MEFAVNNKLKNKPKILNVASDLIQSHQSGLLGGEIMPEDSNPGLDRLGEENLRYLTFPMSLNYQRNSYKLWETALVTWNDCKTRFVFDPLSVQSQNFGVLQGALLKHKVALQPNKQPSTWFTLAKTMVEKYDGKIINLLKKCNFDISLILEELQINNKKDFPYLSGIKICNYWLYVLIQYTDFDFKNRSLLSMAPDTHVMQATKYLGLVYGNATAVDVAHAWSKLLVEPKYAPIDIHTSLWLWSRGGFKDLNYI